MIHALTIPALVAASTPEIAPLTAFQVTTLIDLAAFLVAIWTFWSTTSLFLGGQLQRSFRFISWGILAFAASHLLESLTRGLQILVNGPDVLVTQGAVLASMLFFIPGLAGLADAMPTFDDRKQSELQLKIWPFAVGLAMTISLLSFILYGFTPEAEIIALIGVDGSLILIAAICVVLLMRARIGGVIGRSLWLTMLGLLIFSLAHPLQAWLYEVTGLSADTLAVLHRLIAGPAFILFAFSIARLARGLDRSPKVDTALNK
ncbi:MAG TPA: hypothetical protein VFU69_16715 [Ktedonobacterales bacterium]|nr:hypothetical protein [Ktedonobacterales bacterium]